MRSHNKAFFILLLLQTLYLSPIILKGEVVFPHSNGLEIAGFEVEDSNTISNRKFSDHSSVYIPEINQQLHGKQIAWLSTWNPYVQLGRPTFQLAGFGKAYLITHILSVFIDNPFTLYTILIVITIYLTGIFCFLFLKALNLHPIACLSIAAGLSLSTFLAYWLTFIMFLSTVCWTLALLWLITEFIAKRSYFSAFGICFAIYSLLLTAFLQLAIMQFYLIAGFSFVSLWWTSGRVKTKFSIASGLIGAIVFGVISAAPVFLDIAIQSQRSARINVGDEFFLEVLPKIQNINDLGLFTSQLFDTFWFGNPIKPTYPFVFNGLSLTPVFFSFFLITFVDGQIRRLWPWQLFILACLIATLWPPAYLFMIHYMGFNLSRALPLGGAIIPAFVLAGYGIDHILRRGVKQTFLMYILLVLPLILIGLVGLNQYGQTLDIGFMALCFLLITGVVGFVITRQPYLLILLVIVSVFAYGFNILLIRPQATIQLSSPLTDKIRQEISDGTRYAIVGQDVRALPPNQEALFQLKSIHSYDSLSSRNFQRLVLQLSETGTETYGRYFKNIASSTKLNPAVLSYTGTKLFLSRQPLDLTLFTEIGEVNGIKFYKIRTPPLLLAQLTQFEPLNNHQVIINGPLNDQPRLKADQITTFDDFMQFRLTPINQPTLLFISQQFHPGWQATSVGKPLTAVTVNDFYLGVIIPPQTTEVDLEFKPFVRWSWLPQLIYITLALVLLIKWLIISTRRVQRVTQNAKL